MILTLEEDRWKSLQHKIEQKFQEKGIEVNSCLCIPMSHGHIAKDERTIMILLERHGKYTEINFLIKHCFYNIEVVLEDLILTIHEYNEVETLILTKQMNLNQFFNRWFSK